MQAERQAAGLPAVKVSVEVIEGDTARELEAAAAKSAVLVIGQRGHRWPSEIIRSTSETFANNPPCPLLIIPAQPT